MQVEALHRLREGRRAEILAHLEEVEEVAEVVEVAEVEEVAAVAAAATSAPAAPTSAASLSSLSRRELQSHAKRLGIRANLKSAEIIRQIVALRDEATPQPAPPTEQTMRGEGPAAAAPAPKAGAAPKAGVLHPKAREAGNGVIEVDATGCDEAELEEIFEGLYG